MTDAENSLHARHATVAKRLSYLPLRSARTDRGCGRNDPCPNRWTRDAVVRWMSVLALNALEPLNSVGTSAWRSP